jgi:hypothetical protein
MSHQASKQTKAGRDLRQTARWWDRTPSRSCADKPRHCEERSDEAIQGRRHRVWIASSQTLLAMTKKESETPKGVSRNLRALTGTARALVSLPLPLAGEGREGARSPLGVPPRHLRRRTNATAQLAPRDFLGRVRRAHPDGSKDARVATPAEETQDPSPTNVTAGVTRALLSQSSEIAPADRS